MTRIAETLMIARLASSPSSPRLRRAAKALVSCPIVLHAACSSAERIAFRQINKATGNRLRHRIDDQWEATGEIIAGTAIEAHSRAVFLGNNLKAIVLDLVEP
jgi:non-homologous end joining protein Ku